MPSTHEVLGKIFSFIWLPVILVTISKVSIDVFILTERGENLWSFKELKNLSKVKQLVSKPELEFI